MKIKKWILMEVPENGINSFCPECGLNVRVDQEDCCIYCGATAKGSAVDSFKILTGSIELMQAAYKEAGVVWTREIPKGSWFFANGRDGWCQSRDNLPVMEETFVIPSEPEPCPNCQSVKPGRAVGWLPLGSYDNRGCVRCGRPESEWTYAEPDWAGIGSGIV